jgi:hypothetical protein
MFIKKIKNHFKVIIVLFLLLSISIYTRIWNLMEWILPSDSEIRTVYNLNRKPLSNYLTEGLELSSSWFPIIGLTKLFFFITSFPEYRYITASISILAILFTFLTVYFITKKLYIGLLTSLLIVVNIHILYESRLYWVNALDFIFPPIILYLYFRWTKTKASYFFPLIFLFLALAINNHGQQIYFVTIMIVWSIFLLIKRQIKLKIFFISILIFLVVMSPYLNSMYIGKFSVNQLRYYYIGYADFKLPQSLYLVNLIHPSKFFLDRVNAYLTLNLISETTTQWMIVFVMLFIPIYVFLKNGRKDNNLKFLFFCSYGTLILLLFSIIPAYDMLYIYPFFISFIVLLAKELNLKQKTSIIAIVPIIFIFISNTFYVLPNIQANDYKNFDSLWPKNTNKLFIEGVVFSNLKYTNFLDNIKEIYIFECQIDSIYSVDPKYNKIYNWQNDSIGKADSNFFMRMNLTSDSTIIFGNRCIAYSNFYGIDADERRGLNNSYTNIKFPIEYVNQYNGIAIYKIS